MRIKYKAVCHRVLGWHFKKVSAKDFFFPSSLTLKSMPQEVVGIKAAQGFS